MADDADKASELEERQRQDAIIRAWMAPFVGDSLEECEECDAGIPEARRLAIPGVTLCVECQSFAEGKR